MLKRQNTLKFAIVVAMFALFTGGCGSDPAIPSLDGDISEVELETIEGEVAPECTKEYYPDLGEACEAYTDCYGTWECTDDNTDVYCMPDSGCAPAECTVEFFPALGDSCEAYYDCYGTLDCNDDVTALECIPGSDCPPVVDGDIDGNDTEAGACNPDAFPELGEVCEAYYGCYGVWSCTEDNSAVFCRPDEDCDPPPVDGDIDSDVDLIDEDLADPELDPEPDIVDDIDNVDDVDIVDEIDDVDSDTGPYDPPYDGLENLSDADLKYALYNIIKGHNSLGYSNAKEVLFGDIDNISGRVQCVYTGTWITTSGIPNNNTMNTEHTWAQSWGADREPARSDMHHLFPTLSPVNSRRSNHPFGWVVSQTWTQGGSRIGDDEWGDTVFEVRPENRGNTARAILYFAVRYSYTVDAHMEDAMRDWNTEDPPDTIERTRNNNIETYQHNRNPFVDHPEFVDHISDF